MAKAGAELAYSPGMKDFVSHGSHELSAALFNGGAFVMYQHGRHGDQEQDKQQEAQKEIQKEQERGGR